MILLNAAGLVLFLLSAWLLVFFAGAIRPASAPQAFTFSSGTLIGLVVPLVWMVGITMLMLILHEAIHGLFIGIYTGSLPQFGFRGLYAFAAAPDWYIKRGSYLFITLAPVSLMTLAGIAAVVVVPENLLLALLFLVSMNLSGSVGDMMVAAILLREPAHLLAQDYGDGVRLYCPTSSQSV